MRGVDGWSNGCLCLLTDIVSRSCNSRCPGCSRVGRLRRVGRRGFSGIGGLTGSSKRFERFRTSEPAIENALSSRHGDCNRQANRRVLNDALANSGLRARRRSCLFWGGALAPGVEPACDLSEAQLFNPAFGRLESAGRLDRIRKAPRISAR